MFISFEGIDFSGKTTQIDRLRKYFDDNGRQALTVREPGGISISESIRSILLDRAHRDMHGVTELLLFSAARSQLVHEVIQPALLQGVDVIADRFYDSTTAYQGFGRGLDIERIIALHEIAAHGLIPDLTFVIDITVEESIRRRRQGGRERDRMEMADQAFFQRVRDGYHTLAVWYSSRIHIIDGMASVESISGQIQEAIEHFLQERESRQ
jgi:dTMP kinase